MSFITPRNAFILFILALLGYVWYLRTSVDSLRADKATLEAVNESNVKEMRTIIDNYAKNTQALESDIKVMQIRNQKTQILLERIRHEKDAPASAVLAVTLDGLRTPNKN